MYISYSCHEQWTICKFINSNGSNNKGLSKLESVCVIESILEVNISPSRESLPNKINLVFPLISYN